MSQKKGQSAGFGAIRGRAVAYASPVEGETPGWVAVLVFTSREGIVELTSVELIYVAEHVPELSAWLAQRDLTHPFPLDPPPRGITTRLLRRVNWGELEADARAFIASPAGRWAMPDGWAANDGKVPHRRRRGDEAYALLAVRYEALMGDRVRDPVAVLSESEGLSKATVRNRLSEARRRGLLTSPGQGRVGGRATERARMLVDGIGR